MSFNKETWGNTIWFLFHTIAHKIKESELSNNISDIEYIVKTISYHLPCPDCSNHAKTILEKVNFNNISSKEELKLFIFNFHNHVNKKLDKKIFSIEELNVKYEKANFDTICNNFFIIFSANSNIPQLMSETFHRKKNIPIIKLKIDKIKQFFE